MGFWLSHSGQGRIRLLATNCDEWKAEKLVNDAPLLSVVVKLARMGSVHLPIRPLQAVKRPDIMALDVDPRSILFKEEDHVLFEFPFILADFGFVDVGWRVRNIGACRSVAPSCRHPKILHLHRIILLQPHQVVSALSVFPHPHRSLSLLSFFRCLYHSMILNSLEYFICLPE